MQCRCSHIMTEEQVMAMLFQITAYIVGLSDVIRRLNDTVAQMHFEAHAKAAAPQPMTQAMPSFPVLQAKAMPRPPSTVPKAKTSPTVVLPKAKAGFPLPPKAKVGPPKPPSTPPSPRLHKRKRDDRR